jgi:biopolymer transport protein ExbD
LSGASAKTPRLITQEPTQSFLPNFQKLTITMPKVKAKRANVSLDMTAMCDVAFLLLTFFMLTAKFRPEEAVTIDPPSSISEKQVDLKGMVTISVSNEGQVFLATDDKNVRETMLNAMLQRYSVALTPDQRTRFMKSEIFGYPMAAMKRALDLEPSDLKSSGLQKGIPCDSVNNELFFWMIHARQANPGLKIAIKGDSKSNFKAFSQVVGTLQTQNINVFQLITSAEGKPKAAPKAN